MIDETINVVVSSRVRLARNYKGMPFPQNLDDIQAVQHLISVADKATDFKHKIYFMDDLDDIDKQALVERHLISPDLAKKQLGALILSEDESIAIMVNEEDHIRAQCIKNGFALNECYNSIDRYDVNLSNCMPIAYDSEFGYLTSCLTNVGTGMRASVMLFLPALTFSERIDELINDALKKGVTFRGVYGEKSNAVGCMYQLSNAISIGKTEQTLIEIVEKVAMDFCKQEQGERNNIVSRDKYEFTDRVYRAYGILCNARIISSSEFMNCIAMLKFGMAMNIISFKNVKMLDELILRAQPANLLKFADKKSLSAEERDLVRAHLVRETMELLK